MNEANMYKKKKSLSLFFEMLLVYFLLYVSSIICIKNNIKLKNANLFSESEKKTTKKKSAEEQELNVPLNHQERKETAKKKETNTKSTIIKETAKPKIETIAEKSVEGFENNPWEPFMEIFDIPKNHAAGVRVDLKGFGRTGNFHQHTEKYYRYSAGRCPVFGKIIKIRNNNWFLDKTVINKLNRKKFLKDARTGTVPGIFKVNSSTGMQFSTVAQDTLYKNWTSPLKSSSIIECAKYANNLEHDLKKLKENYNCINSTGMCLKQPFVYDLDNKTCYILYSVMQEKKGTNTFDYWPKKSVAHSNLVFGSSSVREDWRSFCATKPLKGVAFGVWNDHNCERMTRGQKIKNATLFTCGVKLFDESPSDGVNNKNIMKIKKEKKEFGENHPVHVFNPLSSLLTVTDGKGYNWANWDDNNGCEIFDETPNCFVQIGDGFAFTSTAIADPSIYDLPPCFSSSENWVVEANCIDGKNRKYKCTDGMWLSNDNHKIHKCISKFEWANLMNDTVELVQNKAKINENENKTKEQGEEAKKMTQEATENEAEATENEAEAIENEAEKKKKTEEKKKPKESEYNITDSTEESISETPYESDKTSTWKIAGAILSGVTLLSITAGLGIYFCLNKGKPNDISEDSKETEQFMGTDVRNDSIEEQYISPEKQPSLWMKRDSFDE